MLRQSYPQVKFIQSDRNLGFAKANNEAFKRSCGRNLLFLNPDTVIAPSAINILYDWQQRLLNVGAVGCKLLNADKTVQTSCIQSFPTIINQLLDSEFFRKLWPKSTLWGMAPLFSSENEPKKVEVLSGACIMLKRSLFESIGLFSEDYFMYTEDIDLCYKISKSGFWNYYIPNASVIHFGGGSTQNAMSDFSVVMMRESIWRFLKKTRGNIYGLGYRISSLISAIGRLIFLMCLLPFQLVRQGQESFKASLRKWKAVLRWSLGIGIG
jgi:GT2 family glycosyltransferase